MIVLVDGDIFRYRCGFAAERNYYLVELTNANDHKEWKEFDYKKEAEAYGRRVVANVSASYRVWQRKEIQPVENCLQIVKLSLTQVIEDIRVKFKEEVETRVYLSGKGNFRETAAVTKPYKGNREDTAKPMYYKEIGEYLRTTYNAITTEGIEADDAIGISATECRERQVACCVVSNDKDLRQIPGNHYNWVTKEFFSVSPKEAKTRFFIQLLAGDPTDNVPGLPGIGEARAAKLLEDAKSPEEMVDACWDAYWETDNLKLDKYATVRYFLEQANLVYILRDKNNFWEHTKEGKYFKEKYMMNEEKQIEIPAASQRA